MKAPWAEKVWFFMENGSEIVSAGSHSLLRGSKGPLSCSAAGAEGVKGTGSRACPPVGSHLPLPSCVSSGKLLKLSVTQKNGDDDTCLLELFVVKFSE